MLPVIVKPVHAALPAGHGHKLEHYELLKTLGTGAFGKVLLVRDCLSDRKLALKVLEKKKVVQLKQVEHTMTERNILAAVDFPFIVGMSASFKDERNLYMALEVRPLPHLRAPR